MRNLWISGANSGEDWLLWVVALVVVLAVRVLWKYYWQEEEEG